MKNHIDPDAQIEAEMAALEAQGIDPYADRTTEPEADPGEDADDSSVTPEAPAEQAAAEAPADEPGTEPAAEAATEQEPATQEPAATQPAPVAPYNAALPADYKAQRTELLKAKADAMKQLMDGTIDAEEYAALDTGIADKLEDLTALRIRAETLAEANNQTQQASQAREIQALIARTKNEVDYAGDAKAAKQFDTAMALLAADPDNAALPFGELIQMTHKMVAGMRGVTVAAKAPTGPKPAPDRTPPKPPVTLSGLPTAATSGAQSVAQAVGKLSGDDLERAFDSMNDADFKKLLRG